MKASLSFIIAAWCAVSSATPTPTYKGNTPPTIEKPATAFDNATLGYATLNGGYVISSTSIPRKANGR